MESFNWASDISSDECLSDREPGEVRSDMELEDEARPRPSTSRQTPVDNNRGIIIRAINQEPEVIPVPERNPPEIELVVLSDSSEEEDEDDIEIIHPPPSRAPTPMANDDSETEFEDFDLPSEKGSDSDLPSEKEPDSDLPSDKESNSDLPNEKEPDSDVPNEKESDSDCSTGDDDDYESSSSDDEDDETDYEAQNLESEIGKKYKIGKMNVTVVDCSRCPKCLKRKEKAEKKEAQNLADAAVGASSSLPQAQNIAAGAGPSTSRAPEQNLVAGGGASTYRAPAPSSIPTSLNGRSSGRAVISPIRFLRSPTPPATEGSSNKNQSALGTGMSDATTKQYSGTVSDISDSDEELYEPPPPPPPAESKSANDPKNPVTPSSENPPVPGPNGSGKRGILKKSTWSDANNFMQEQVADVHAEGTVQTPNAGITLPNSSGQLLALGQLGNSPSAGHSDSVRSNYGAPATPCSSRSYAAIPDRGTALSKSHNSPRSERRNRSPSQPHASSSHSRSRSLQGRLSSSTARSVSKDRLQFLNPSPMEKSESKNRSRSKSRSRSGSRGRSRTRKDRGSERRRDGSGTHPRSRSGTRKPDTPSSSATPSKRSYSRSRSRSGGRKTPHSSRSYRRSYTRSRSRSRRRRSSRSSSRSRERRDRDRYRRRRYSRSRSRSGGRYRSRSRSPDRDRYRRSNYYYKDNYRKDYYSGDRRDSDYYGTNYHGRGRGGGFRGRGGRGHWSSYNNVPYEAPRAGGEQNRNSYGEDRNNRSRSRSDRKTPHSRRETFEPKTPRTPGSAMKTPRRESANWSDEEHLPGSKTPKTPHRNSNFSEDELESLRESKTPKTPGPVPQTPYRATNKRSESRWDLEPKTPGHGPNTPYRPAVWGESERGSEPKTSTHGGPKTPYRSANYPVNENQHEPKTPKTPAQALKSPYRSVYWGDMEHPSEPKTPKSPGHALKTPHRATSTIEVDHSRAPKTPGTSGMVNNTSYSPTAWDESGDTEDSFSTTHLDLNDAKQQQKESLFTNSIPLRLAQSVNEHKSPLDDAPVDPINTFISGLARLEEEKHAEFMRKGKKDEVYVTISNKGLGDTGRVVEFRRTDYGAVNLPNPSPPHAPSNPRVPSPQPVPPPSQDGFALPLPPPDQSFETIRRQFDYQLPHIFADDDRSEVSSIAGRNIPDESVESLLHDYISRHRCLTCYESSHPQEECQYLRDVGRNPNLKLMMENRRSRYFAQNPEIRRRAHEIARSLQNSYGPQ